MAAKPREVSSSDAESDSESQPVQQKRTRKRHHTKYQCPSDFTSCDFRLCASAGLESVNDGNKELWLIKAPLTFNPDSFSGVRFPTMGLETVQPHTRPQQVYTVLSRPVAAGNARLLTSAGHGPGDALLAPAFSGVVNISESYGDCRGNRAPVPIPALRAPVIPEGLRQRFQPFGSRTASGLRSDARGREGEGAADTPAPAKRADTHPEQSKTPKKKKKKKDKRIKVEKEEMVEEEVSVTASRGTPREPTPGAEAEEEKKRKKKRKSKDRDRGETEESGRGAETGLSLKEEVVVKTEPWDLSYGGAENLVKKKKVKKEKRPKQD